MTPKVMEWDKKYASDEEKVLAREANQKSGIKALMNSNPEEGITTGSAHPA